LIARLVAEGDVVEREQRPDDRLLIADLGELNAIEARNQDVLSTCAPAEGLSRSEVAHRVVQDMTSVARMADPDRRASALQTMGYLADMHSAYAAELVARNPRLAKEAEAAWLKHVREFGAGDDQHVIRSVGGREGERANLWEANTVQPL
jgi:hypothetical protein